MSADVQSRDVTTTASAGDRSRAALADDGAAAGVAELLSGRSVRVSPKPLSPAIERIFDSLYWSTGLGRDRVSAEMLAVALVADRESGESVWSPMVGNGLSRMKNAFFYWPQTLVDALEAEAVMRGWTLPVLIEYLTARYLVGWTAELTRRDIDPLRVTS